MTTTSAHLARDITKSGERMPAAAKLAIFGSDEGNFSLDRYAREFSETLLANHELNLYAPKIRSGIWRKLWDKFSYMRHARQWQGERNLITNSGNAFLLLGIDPSKTICICHDVIPLIYPGRSFRYQTLFRMNLRLMRKAKAIVAVSEHIRQQLLRHCAFIPAEKIFVVHNGLHSRWRRVDSADKLNQFRREHGLAGKRFILHAGNDNWFKNFSALLRAMAALEDRELMLVKAGPLGTQNLQLVRDLGLTERFVHFPVASDEELLLLYSSAEGLVFPSLEEGFGWPPLEAMACGCPVIVSHRGALPEVCGDAAVYIDPEHPEVIGAAIMRVISDAQLRQKLINGGVNQSRKYDWNRTAQSILDLFQN